MKQPEIDKIVEIYEYYSYRCFVCHEIATQRSHIIGDTKANRKKYGDHIIDNPLNWLPAHDLTCNALIDIGKNDKLIMEVIDQIHSDCKITARSNIENIVRDNIKRKRSKK